MPSGVRRRPRQQRSRATVEAILDGAARVLERHGYQGASTNAIAHAAGVSPGTLYQYFSDREAILGELTDRLVTEFETVLTPILRSLSGQDPTLVRRRLIDAVLAGLEPRADLLRAIVDRVPGIEQAARLASIRDRLLDAIHHLQLATDPSIAPGDADAAAWFILEIGQQLTVRYVLDRPPISRDQFASTLERVLAAAGHPASTQATRPLNDSTAATRAHSLPSQVKPTSNS